MKTYRNTRPRNTARSRQTPPRANRAVKERNSKIAGEVIYSVQVAAALVSNGYTYKYIKSGNHVFQDVFGYKNFYDGFLNIRSDRDAVNVYYKYIRGPVYRVFADVEYRNIVRQMIILDNEIIQDTKYIKKKKVKKSSKRYKLLENKKKLYNKVKKRLRRALGVESAGYDYDMLKAFTSKKKKKKSDTYFDFYTSMNPMQYDITSGDEYTQDDVFNEVRRLSNRKPIKARRRDPLDFDLDEDEEDDLLFDGDEYVVYDDEDDEEYEDDSDETNDKLDAMIGAINNLTNVITNQKVASSNSHSINFESDDDEDDDDYDDDDLEDVANSVDDIKSFSEMKDMLYLALNGIIEINQHIKPMEEIIYNSIREIDEDDDIDEGITINAPEEKDNNEPNIIGSPQEIFKNSKPIKMMQPPVDEDDEQDDVIVNPEAAASNAAMINNRNNNKNKKK